MVRRPLAVVMMLATLLGAARTTHAQAPTEPEAQGEEVTPARLSYLAGAVSFWRPGGADWAPAQSNTPLAPGDELYTGHDGNLEVQVGGRAFIRAWGDTQVGLVSQDASFLQVRVGAGHVALDLHALDAGDLIEIDAPGAAFTIKQPGYYRVDVNAERTTFLIRRSGQATITTATGPAGVVQAGEAVLVDGATVQRVAAPEQDVWDRWNDTRTAALIATTSARYLPPQVYGASELDRYGAWRTEPEYGAVWVPASVPVGWAPYSTGRWVWDPRFGWTWIDTAPWGWAPYHYGRWVHVGGLWAWAPGPVVVRPVYAPALVAFFGVPGVSITVAGPSVGWVALGWGEPLVPWWGRPGFVGRPSWGGWGGPRVHNVTVHRNVTVVNAVVVVRSDHFGRRPVRETRIARPDISKLEPVRGRLAVKPEPVSFAPGTGPARVRPPDAALTRPVVSTKPAAPRPEPPRASEDRQDAKRGPQPGARTDARPETRDDVRPGGKIETRPEPKAQGGQHPGPKVAPPTAPPPAKSGPPTAVTPPAAPRSAAPAHPPATAPGVGAPHPPAMPPGEPRPQVGRPEAPRPDQRREPPRGEPSQPDFQRPEPRRPEGPRSETPRTERPRQTEIPRAEPPRRAAAHGNDAGRRPEPSRLVPPETRTAPGHGASRGRPEATTPGGHSRPER